MFFRFLVVGIITCSFLLSACNSSDGDVNISDDTSADNKTSTDWFQQGQETVLKRAQFFRQQAENEKSLTQKAKNIIFVLGDGMGVSTLTAARIYAGQQQGLAGEEFSLSFERFPYSALIKTYNVDLQVPDSAGTMSALMTGVKTNEGIISLPASAQRGDCSSIALKNQSLTTLIDIAKTKDKATAMVTTARVTHATPATTYAHSVDRNWESDHALNAAAREAGCKDIAAQFIDNKQRPLDILLGGGRRHFLPQSLGGKRLDQRNLIAQWQREGGQYVGSSLQLQAWKNSAKRAPVLGLFANSHMAYEYQRPATQPSLKQMTSAALQHLASNAQGYALIIESGRIDHGHHDGTAYKALTETQQLHETVAWLLTQVDLNETLIVVTADHSHGMAMAGYATRGNPMLGWVKGNDQQGYPQTHVSLDDFGQPYTSLSYRDGPGAKQSSPQWEQLNTYHSDYQQKALVPMDYESHGGEDVALYAIGPQAQLFSGTLEQHWLFHALKYAM